MLKDWNIKAKQTFNKSHSKIDWLIDLITSIRSAKVDLNVSPGSFIDISTSELNSKNVSIINDNLENCYKQIEDIILISKNKSIKDSQKSL